MLGRDVFKNWFQWINSDLFFNLCTPHGGRALTFCVHVAIAPLLFTQFFEGAVRGVEREQLGGARLAERLAQLHQRGA